MMKKHILLSLILLLACIPACMPASESKEAEPLYSYDIEDRLRELNIEWPKIKCIQRNRNLCSLYETILAAQ